MAFPRTVTGRQLRGLKGLLFVVCLLPFAAMACPEYALADFGKEVRTKTFLCEQMAIKNTVS